MLSIIVPAYREPFLGKTVTSLLDNAQGDIEVLPVLDGWQPDSPLPSDTRVKPISLNKNVGKRGAINVAVGVARGENIMLIDAHCMVGPGFDTALTTTLAENWLVVPRRYSLDPQTWGRDDSRPIVDYHYLSFPENSSWGFGFYARQWDRRTLGRKSKPEYTIDDTMTLQASCWVANKTYFTKHLYPLNDSKAAYGSLAQDQQELALNYWLGGGEVKVNKGTWYAHLSKRWYHYSRGMFSRKHKKDENYISGNTWGTLHWLANKQPGMLHPFSWLLEKFWPVPEWPVDWQDQIAKLITHYETS